MSGLLYHFRKGIFPRTLMVAALFLLSLSLAPKSLADQESEQYKISYMLNALGASDLVFIRNGAEYTGQEAKDHLEKKLVLADGLVRTAEDFINYIGSESSMTGIPYHVRFADGTQIKAALWLRGILVGMKSDEVKPK